MKAHPFELLKFTPKPAAPTLSAEEQYVLDCYRRVQEMGTHRAERFLCLLPALADIFVPGGLAKFGDD